jgi:hypothetical protein
MERLRIELARKRLYILHVEQLAQRIGAHNQPGFQFIEIVRRMIGR